MAELKAWKEQLTKAKKTAIIQGGVRKVHYEMPRDEQLSEDYDMKTGNYTMYTNYIYNSISLNKQPTSLTP